MRGLASLLFGPEVVFWSTEVAGSLVIAESGEHWFRVSGSAKTKPSEINFTWDPFGKANRKAEQIISMMKTMAR